MLFVVESRFILETKFFEVLFKYFCMPKALEKLKGYLLFFLFYLFHRLLYVPLFCSDTISFLLLAVLCLGLRRDFVLTLQSNPSTFFLIPKNTFCKILKLGRAKLPENYPRFTSLQSVPLP